MQVKLKCYHIQKAHHLSTNNQQKGLFLHSVRKRQALLKKLEKKILHFHTVIHKK